MCSLRFDIEENIIIEAFASETLSFAFDVSESFHTILWRPVQFLEVSTPRGPELHLDVAAL